MNFCKEPTSHEILPVVRFSHARCRVIQTACTAPAVAVSIFWNRPGFAEAKACRGLSRSRQQFAAEVFSSASLAICPTADRAATRILGLSSLIDCASDKTTSDSPANMTVATTYKDGKDRGDVHHLVLRCAALVRRSSRNPTADSRVSPIERKQVTVP